MFKNKVSRIIAIALVAASSVAAINAAPVEAEQPEVTAAPTAYKWYEDDEWAFWDASGSKVWTAGWMRWYWDTGTLWQTVYRGQTYQGAFVWLNAPGCLWAKITWNTLTGSVSMPPSGSVSGNTTSDGWWKYCGDKGYWIDLGNIGHASYTLTSATVCIGYSFNATHNIRRNQSCKKMSYGYQ